ncbi:uncharacterized protein BN674_00953 [Firmicutes bacterium CAG:475]|nr:uncharacterized protein BN674_00953 [Firmicutes bacterium CAG:475]
MLNGNRNFEVRFFRLDVKGLVVKHHSAFVEILHVVRNTALETEHVVLARAAGKRHTQIVDDDGYAFVEIRNVAHTLRNYGIIEFFFAENSLVGLKLDGRTRALHLSYNRKRSLDNAAFYLRADLRRPKFRPIQVAVTFDVNREPLRKSVRNGCADAVQTARVVVLSVVELCACVKLCENNFYTADFELGMLVNGDAATVVAHSCDVVVQKLYANGVAVAVCRFVDTVVDDFPKDVMHALAARRADVHTRAFSYGVQTFQNPNIAGFVILICHTVNLYKYNNIVILPQYLVFFKVFGRTILWFSKFFKKVIRTP